ncbi:conserved unknown protein [Ectocarpus siliculosus]|uniref:FHA domain-containing protein n=1 Tax=Ectocarpus siliculosus TaxID=2880 RepID=D8LE72_ECTSI|nr:conserved unknown protein [Ectocarpus siliculosus]|eukprot:CBN74145.1 conserved unknown protein [Ectocarpus siliculosus]
MEPPPPVPAPIIVAGTRAKETGVDGNSSAATAGSTAAVSPPLDKAQQSALDPAKDGSASLPPPPPKTAGSLNGDGVKAVASGGYKPPSWGLTEAPGASGLSLTVLKGGVEVGSISLDNRTHVLLGRQQGVVDVLLEHPSISRKHAILQHGQNGALFLFDNGSTHGCSVNKKKIPPKEFHRLHVGDVIKFGESTRLYALEGPEELRPAEYESDNLRNLRLDAGRKQLAAKLAKIKAGGAGEGGGKGGGDSGEYGISWGFDEDAVAEEEDEDGDGAERDEDEVELPDYLKTEAQKRRRRDTKIGLTEDNVHKRDAKLFEKLQLKLTKIEEIEETIRSKNKARERGKEGGEGGSGGEEGGRKAGRGTEDGEEDDDYYDRTAPVVPTSSGTSKSDLASKKAEIKARRFGARDKTKKLSAVTPPADDTAAAERKRGVGPGQNEAAAQSLEALTRRGEAVVEDLERTQAGLAELEAEEAGEAALAEDGGVAADPLDMFMTENRRKERQQAIVRLTAKREALREEQALLKVMVEAARPSMPTLKKSPAPAAATASVAATKEETVPVPETTTRGSGSSSSDQAAEPDDRKDTRAAAVDREHMPGGGGYGEAMPGSTGSGSHEKYGDEVEKTAPSRAVLAPEAASTLGSMPSPVAPPCRSNAIPEARKSPAGTVASAGTRERGVEKGQAETRHPGVKEGKEASGTKKRGTPVGTSMLPPPPSKRQQRRAENSKAGLAGENDDDPVEPKAKRTVKGPAMPPPLGKPSKVGGGVSVPTAVARVGEKVAGKEALEGGDVDWVPPKDALEKMAALNRKFGY